MLDQRPVVLVDGGRVFALLPGEQGCSSRSPFARLEIWNGQEWRALVSPCGDPSTYPIPRGDVVVCVSGVTCGLGEATLPVRAYSLSQTEPPGWDASPIEQVKRLLLRCPAPGHHEQCPASPEISSLARITGHEEALLGLARDRTSSLRALVVHAIGRLAIRGGESVLLDILDEPVPPPPEGLWFGVGLTLDQRLELLDSLPPGWDGRQERFAARHLRDAAIIGLASFPTPPVAAKLAPLLDGGPPGDVDADEVTAAIHRVLARSGLANALEALQSQDQRRRLGGGWKKLCARADADSSPVRWTSICEGGLERGPFRILSGSDSRLWLRRREGRAWSPPALALQVDSWQRADSVRWLGGRLRLHGGTGPWDADVIPAEVLRDDDSDGIADRTELFLGTDPRLSDTDGDSFDDGEDASPLGVPRNDDVSRVAAEAIRYAALTVIAPRPARTLLPLRSSSARSW